jgi:hypothetical protein
MANKVKLVSSTRIYLDANALLDHILEITPGFPRQYKYSVGGKMHDLAIDLIQDIAAAYMNRDRETRIGYLVAFQVKFETLKTLVRKAGEKKWILSKGRHAQIVELMDAIGKQCTAWKNSLIASSKGDSE